MNTATSIKYVLLTLCAMASLSSALADPLAALATGAEQGNANVSLRYRLEHVDQDLPLDAADASTIRVRVTAATAEVEGWSATLELDHVAAIGPQRYNSLANGNGQYAVVADPVGTDLNQAWIGYRINSAGQLTAGRQRILHGNQRFVGGVGWRQNEQTYDGLSYSFREGEAALDYAYVWDVNRVFSGKEPSAQIEAFHGNSHLLLASWTGISGFVYALDFDNAGASSGLTYGLAYDGARQAFRYGVAVARQQDHGSNTQDYSALYYRLEGAYELTPLTLSAGYEVLGSDGGTASFATPLATLHAFQGWADAFLNTGSSTGIPMGVEDLHLVHALPVLLPENRGERRPRLALRVHLENPGAGRNAEVAAHALHPLCFRQHRDREGFRR